MATGETRTTSGALKAARKQAQVTRRQLADLLPVSPSHLRNVENGWRRLTPELHRQIHDGLLALGADPARLPPPPGDTP